MQEKKVKKGSIPKLSDRERKEIGLQRLLTEGRLTLDTNIKAKPGQESLQEINNRICAAKNVEEIFSDMKLLMTSVAMAKGYIKQGQSKIRIGGSPDDFLNFVTIKMCNRWKKQRDEILGGEVGKTKIENWCAYAQIPMFAMLNEYNRSVVDYDFDQWPTQKDHEEEITEVEFEHIKSFEDLHSVFLLGALTPETIRNAIKKLPMELNLCSLDILHYCNYGKILDSSRTQFVSIGVNLFRRSLFDEI